MNRSAFTLIEGLVAMLVLALAIPVSVVMVADAAGARAASVQRERAVMLAGLVRTEIVADVAAPSAGGGVALLDDPSDYENTLRARLADRAAPYTDAGLTWSIGVGNPVGPQGVHSMDADLNIYRPVIVSVTWNDAREGPRDLDITIYVSEVGA